MPRTVETLIGVMDPNYFSFAHTFERLLAFLDLHIKHDGVEHHVGTQRLKSRPYDVLRSKCPYAAVVNRGTHWNKHFNSYLMTVSRETYQLNNMVSFHAIDKNTGYGHMYKLGMKIPPTVAIPQQDYSEIMAEGTIRPELMFEHHEMFDLHEIGGHVGYPAFLKPQSGGGWKGVERVTNDAELLEKYNKSGETPVNLQKAVNFREFVRTMGIGPQMLPMHYNPDAPQSHDRYMRKDGRAVDHFFISAEERDEISKLTKIINAFYGWHHNTCEALIDVETGDVQPIDFCNAYPDSSLTSLHFFFPEVIKNMARWMVFVAVTGRKGGFTFTKEWPAYWEIVERAEKEEWDYKTRIDALAKIADRHFETARFEEFCDTHLADLDERALAFFSTDEFFHIIRREIEYFFTFAHEHDAKFDHYAGIHRFWMTCEAQRLSGVASEAANAAPNKKAPAKVASRSKAGA